MTIMADANVPSKPTAAEVREYAAQLAALTIADVTVVLNPLDPAELFVSVDSLTTTLPHVRPMLPVEWQGADLHRFEPVMGRFGTWVLRLDIPVDHEPRIWGTATDWCGCTACDAYRFARVVPAYMAAMDLGLTADDLGLGE
jgi:hypothetical protein